MSLATVRSPLRDIKLLFIEDKKRKCTYAMFPLINSGSTTISDIFHKFLPDSKIRGADPIYTTIRRNLKKLADRGYIKLQKRFRIDWDKTDEIRLKEYETSVQDIFRLSIDGHAKDTPPFISTGTLTGGQHDLPSTAKITENSFHVVPTGKILTLLSRMQNSNHFYENAKSRTENGQLRADLLDQKMQSAPKSCRCPYRISSRVRGTRLDAVFQLRRINQHRKFKRRDQRVVNPELVRDLDYVQAKFDNYVEDIQDLKCALIHREDGHVKLIDYQTRFTDETRKDGVIARFYRTVEKATESYNTGVFLTLTSYPPSEGSRLQHRSSLWHVNRYFARTWNAYISLLQKRKRAARRDELLDVMRSRVKKIRPVLVDDEGKIKLKREERTEALKPMREENFRPKYLMVYEFQKNGMIHGHCTIFGTQWLDSFEQIKADWQRLGQGERIHVYGIKNEGTGWTWSKGQPQDSRNRQPIDYLMKYLGKGVRISQGHGMYWAVNKRFFTGSQVLTQDKDLPAEFEKLPSHYDFLGTIKGDEIPIWLLQRNRFREIGQRAGGGWLDPLGWSTSPGQGVPA
jgi:hypothetical protein